MKSKEERAMRSLIVEDDHSTLILLNEIMPAYGESQSRDMSRLYEGAAS